MFYCTPFGKDKKKYFQNEIQITPLGFITDKTFYFFPLHTYFLSLASFNCLLFPFTPLDSKSASICMYILHYLIREFSHENHQYSMNYYGGFFFPQKIYIMFLDMQNMMSWPVNCIQGIKVNICLFLLESQSCRCPNIKEEYEQNQQLKNKPILNDFKLEVLTLFSWNRHRNPSLCS